MIIEKAIKVNRLPCPGCGLNEYYVIEKDYSLEFNGTVQTKEYHKKDCPFFKDWCGSKGTA